MKIHALMLAVAFAAGTALAATPASTAKAEAAATPSAATTDTASVAPMKKIHRKVAKKHHASAHALAKQHRQYAKASRHGTRAMGAGPAAPMTDLQASSREARIDQAYADWQARRR